MSLRIQNKPALSKILKKYIPKDEQRKTLAKLLAQDFTLGEVAFCLWKERISVAKGFLPEILAIIAKEDVLTQGEGYWVDHWTYNLDLIESYLAVYPEKLKSLLIEKKDFTFFDSSLRVLPRREKYVLVKGKVRQYGAVAEDAAKKKLIAARLSRAHQVRVRSGKGDVYYTTLLVKLLTLVANKTASLDPAGIGIEMEANKPGWCDALNNLPGIFGSSVSETAELKRLILFLQAALDTLALGDAFKVKLPREAADFLKGLSVVLKQSAAKNADFLYWDKSTALKEKFREQTRMGFSGSEKALELKAIKTFFTLALEKLSRALVKSIDQKTGLPYTYFYHTATKYTRSPIVRALAFSTTPVAHFLEGPVHLMKVLENVKQKKELAECVRKSDLYDQKLKMYKLNVSLAGMPDEIGRSKVFSPGWLENESVWLHMEYKYLLELLRGGLYEEFFTDLKTTLVAFMDPQVYGRSILENSSFICSSAHPDSAIHGNGFVARLSGCTSEFLSIWIELCCGQKPFFLDGEGKPALKFAPVLPAWLFTEKEEEASFYDAHGQLQQVVIPKDSFAFVFLGKVLVIYRNPRRKDTFGPQGVRPEKIILKQKGKPDLQLKGGVIADNYALSVRQGNIEYIEVNLE